MFDHAAGSRPGTVVVPARPYAYELEPATTALLIIDMQRDFLEPDGFGELLGNDVSLLARVVEPLRAVPDLTDCPPSKLARGRLEVGIGSPGPKGRILVRGELGHDIIDELAPLPGEVVIDKPGKGSFYATDLELILRNAGIRNLIVTGVTTEVCVHTTVREANDRGFECLVLADCCGSYFPEFHRVALEMVAAQGGIFGWVAGSAELLQAMPNTRPPVLAAVTEGA
jgi:nicotinamidase-related amidase